MKRYSHATYQRTVRIIKTHRENHKEPKTLKISGDSIENSFVGFKYELNQCSMCRENVIDMKGKLIFAILVAVVVLTSGAGWSQSLESQQELVNSPPQLAYTKNTEIYMVPSAVEVSVLSPENRTYQHNDVPLIITVSKPVSWMSYSLDGQMNVTLNSNTTLVGLSEGSHSIIVYAYETDGNISRSEKVYFTIDTKPPNVQILSPENKTYTLELLPQNTTDIICSVYNSWTITGGPFHRGDRLIVQYIPGANWRLPPYLPKDDIPEVGMPTKIVGVNISHPIGGSTLITDVLAPERMNVSLGEAMLVKVLVFIEEGQNESLNVNAYFSRKLPDTDIVRYYLEETGGIVKYDGYYTVHLSGPIPMIGEAPEPPVSLALIRERPWYTSDYVFLNFSVDEKTSWIGYSLDDRANVTIYGNTTLSNLSEGLHSIVVYATDTAGNTGVSKKIYFTIIKTIVPEFPLFSITNVSMIVTLLIAIIYRRNHLKNSILKTPKANKRVISAVFSNP